MPLKVDEASRPTPWAYQNVNWAKSLLDLSDDFRTRVRAQHVRDDRYRLALSPQQCDFIDEREELGLAARNETNGGAGGCKGFGDGPSNAARRARDQSLGCGSVPSVRKQRYREYVRLCLLACQHTSVEQWHRTTRRSRGASNLCKRSSYR